MRTILLVILGLLISACTAPGTFEKHAGQIRQLPAEIFQLGNGVKITDAHPSLLLRIEYLGGITSRGESLWRSKWRAKETAFLSNDPRGAVYIAQLTDEFVNQRIGDTINKTSYYALRVYDYLQKSQRFPRDTLALQGVIIDADPEHPGKLRVIRDGAPLPSVLTLRFLVKRDTQDVTDDVINVPDNTFGNFVAPEMTLFTETAAWPLNGGVIAAVGFGAGKLSAMSTSCDPAQCLSSAFDFQDRLDIRFGARSYRQPPYSAGVESIAHTTQLKFPFGLYLGDLLLPLSPESAFSEQTYAGQKTATAFPLGDMVERLTMQSLDQVDHYLATRMQWRRYIAQFDARLATRWPNPALRSDEQLRLAYIKKVMKAERTLLSAESARFAETMLAGVAGQTLRAQLAAEYSVMQKMQASGRQAAMAALVDVASLMAGQYGPGGHIDPTATMALSQGLAQKEVVHSAALQEMKSQFDIDFEKPSAASNLLSLEIDGESVAAGTLSDFRRAIALKYSQRFPGKQQGELPLCADKLFVGNDSWIGKASLRTGVCDSENKVVGTSYEQYYNHQGVYVCNEESAGKGSDDDVPYYFSEWAFTAQRNGSPETIISVGPSDPGGVDGLLYLLADGMFAAYSDDSKAILKISWSQTGPTYTSKDRATSKVSAASVVEREEIDRQWLHWRTQRAKIIAYEP